MYVLKWLEGSQLQNISLSDPLVNSKWTSFAVCINTYSEKYISIRLQYTLTASSTYRVEYMSTLILCTYPTVKVLFLFFLLFYPFGETILLHGNSE